MTGLVANSTSMITSKSSWRRAFHCLQPNSVSDASWVLPAGITISDLVIELTPSDPRISFS